MEKKTDSLVFKTGILFTVFTLVTLFMCGISIYLSQMRSYLASSQESIRGAGRFLVTLMEREGEDFVEYQEFYLKHYQELKVPIEFDNYDDAWEKYEDLMAEKYPGKVMGRDITPEELDPETQLAWFTYLQEYWQLTFEQAAKSFNMPYAYYNVFAPGEHDVMYLIDGERTTPNDHLEEGEEPDPENDQYMYLGDHYYHDVDTYPEKFGIEWRTYTTGQEQNEFQIWNNEWGHTYSYYTPFNFDGKTLGFVGTEVEVADINKGILMNTLEQTASIAAILLACVIMVVLVIHRRYISKIVRISDNVRLYAQNKDVEIAKNIEEDGDTKDEISALANRIALMIHELENYMKNLLETTRELTETKQHVDDMRVLATKDALTGIRNKTAYDNEVKQLEWSMGDGFTEFGIAMIDLNYLKRINDTFGHEQGNIAIKRLCRIVCTTFDHSPVFRIGGDEFAVVLKNHDYEHIDELVEKFNKTLDDIAKDDSLEQWEKVSAAIGVAFYDPARDVGVENVFKRADRAMYARKKEMKAVREQ